MELAETPNGLSACMILPTAEDGVNGTKVLYMGHGNGRDFRALNAADFNRLDHETEKQHFYKSEQCGESTASHV